MSEGKNASTRGRKRILTDSNRKRNRKETLANYQKTRVNIGREHDRWMELKNALRLQSHADVAKILLDCYESSESPTKKKRMIETYTEGLATPCHSTKHTCITTSTPADGLKPNKSDVILSDMSCISSSDQENARIHGSMSGVEEIKDETDQLSVKRKKKMTSSFVNPFELSLDISVEDTEEDCDNYSSDEDYEPSVIITLRGDDTTFCEEFEVEEDEDFDEQVPDIDVVGLSTIDDLDAVDDFLLTNNPFLVFYQQLLDLANTSIPTVCNKPQCQQPVLVTKDTIGSAVYLKWVCTQGHFLHKWCSQPLLNRRLHSGDLVFAASLFLSGSNYQKVQLMSKFLKLPIPSRSTYYRIQRTYLIPSVDTYWMSHQDEIIEGFMDEDLIIMGDGRMDSPGHCAQYCSYTFMEYNTKKILCIVTMDKRETDRKSTNLEKACFLKGLKYLLDKGLRIVEIITDAHMQIRALMRKDYPQIKHSFDIWHGAKNLGKKVVKVAGEKGNHNKDLMEWTREIVNHYWWCANNSASKEEFIGKWYGILHHVQNVHEWILPYSSTNGCEHGPLTQEREKGWIEPSSPVFTALRKIVMDKRLLNNIPYYLNCRSTSELESFQNLILMYASKRHSYTPPSYRARNELAALDNNSHTHRPVLMNKDGTTRYQRIFQKKSSRWSVCALKSEKKYMTRLGCNKMLFWNHMIPVACHQYLPLYHHLLPGTLLRNKSRDSVPVAAVHWKTLIELLTMTILPTSLCNFVHMVNRQRACFSVIIFYCYIN